MTINQLLRRRAKVLALAILVWSVLLIVVGLLGGRNLSPAVALALFAVLFLAIVSVVFLFKCPKCKGNLGSLVAHFGPLASGSKQVNYCPFCGVNFNETPYS
jgi:hypothetical protein